MSLGGPLTIATWTLGMVLRLNRPQALLPGGLSPLYDCPGTEREEPFAGEGLSAIPPGSSNRAGTTSGQRYNGDLNKS